MNITRTWYMPSKDTFQVKPIGNFVCKYVENSKISIDPFARNSTLATITNDLNPETSAQYHMKALDFLSEMVKQDVHADLVIFDPPYSLNQVKASYNGVGLEFNKYDTTHSIRWSDEKELINKILTKDGIFLHFGWHTNGMGLKRGFEIIEILMVAHGGAHYDTLCLAEKRME